MDAEMFYKKAEIIAKNFYTEKMFSELDCYGFMNKMTSPIEQMFCLALILLRDSNFVDGEIRIYPQYKIGKYSCDFMIEYKRLTGPGEFEGNIIVECDSQEFHDRSERERRYEKTRERFIVSKGFRVLRFTGKEITENPFIPAIEVLSLLTKTNIDDLSSYDG